MSKHESKAFLGEIRQHNDNVFVDIALPKNVKEGEKNTYQYASCLADKALSKALSGLMAAQTVTPADPNQNQKRKASHPFTGVPVDVVISDLFFEVKDNFLNGNGILKSFSISGLDFKPKKKEE